MRLKLLGIALTAGLLASACTDDDDATSTTTTVATSSSSATSTTARVDASSTSTSTTTSTTPTTAAATTTTQPVEEQVRAAMLGYYDFYWRCLRAPKNCDPLEVAVPDSDAYHALTATRDDLIKGGYFVGSEDVGYMVITAIEPADDHTLVTTCWWSTAWLYFQPPGDAPATVQNNTPSSGYETFQFVQTPDLSWKVRRSDLQGPDSAENVCPPQE